MMEAKRIARFWFRNKFQSSRSHFQHEEQRFDLGDVTHLRLTIVPNKDGSVTTRLYRAPPLRLDACLL